MDGGGGGGGAISAEGGQYLLADYDRGGQFPLADCVRGDKICWETESAPTPAMGGIMWSMACMHVAQGSWLPDEAAQSSTWRELVAVLRVLDSIVHKLRNMRVRWFSDNQNVHVVRILEVGSRQPHLQTELLKVVELCMRHNIRMEPGSPGRRTSLLIISAGLWI